jgi:hypothetical protein
MTRLRNLALIAGILLFGVSNLAQAQDSQVSSTDAEAAATAQKEKEALEAKASALLEQVVGQVQLLKLPENRISVQIAAGDMLWARNEARARSMFSLAAEGVAEMMRGAEGNPQRSIGRLRQQLVLTAAQHDATLAYQLLATTQPVTPPSDSPNNFGLRSADANLEQNLLARIAVTDPKLAAQKAEEALASGQYPTSLAQVISNLQVKDKEASAKLTAKVVSKLQSENMLANPQAGNLALFLLRGGPLPAQSSSSVPVVTPGNDFAATPILGETAFQGLMNTVIDAALRATRSQTTNQLGQGNGRGRRNFGGVQNTAQATPTDAQLEQQNARRMLGGLQMLMPQIEQVLPARAAAVRNKMTELGMSSDPRLAFNQVNTLMQQGTADSLVNAASAAPPQMQSRLYQQAAQKALAEGDVEQARQIANDHLQATARDRVLQQVDFQVLATKVKAGNVDQLSQILGALRSDDERIDLLLQLAAQTQKGSGEPSSAAEDDSKAALKFLAEAKRLANRRATNYSQLEQQLRVADAFAALDAAKSFEVLDPGISQLNELLSAAALLNGFELNIFREGELPLEGGNGLSEMVLRYGQELARLAKIDFARAESSANKFNLAESRLLSQLAIVRNVLGVPQVTPVGGGLGGRRMFGRRGQ